MNRSAERQMRVTSDNGLDSTMVSSPGGRVRELALGFAVTALFSVGLYLGISGLVVAFLTLVL